VKKYGEEFVIQKGGRSKLRRWQEVIFWPTQSPAKNEDHAHHKVRMAEGMARTACRWISAPMGIEDPGKPWRNHYQLRSKCAIPHRGLPCRAQFQANGFR